MDTNDYITRRGGSADALSGHHGSDTPWFTHILRFADGTQFYPIHYTYDPSFMARGPNSPSSGAPAFVFHDDYSHVRPLLRITSSSLRTILSDIIPLEHWKEDGSVVTRKQIFRATLKIHQSAQVHDKKSYVYRELGLLLDCVHGRPMYRLGHVQEGKLVYTPNDTCDSKGEEPLWVNCWEPPSNIACGITYWSIRPKAPEYLDQNPEESFIIRSPLGSSLQDLESQDESIRVCYPESKPLKKLIRMCSVPGLFDKQYTQAWLQLEMYVSCATVQHLVRLANKGSTHSSSAQQLSTLVSKHLRIWSRAVQTVNDIFDNNVSQQGLNWEEAVCLVMFADCIRFVPGLDLHHFCSSTELRADLFRYTDMVKLEDRPMFYTFVELMYEVDVSKSVKLDITNNVSYFSTLFKHIAAKISGPPSVVAETPNTDAPDTTTRAEKAKFPDPLLEASPPLPSPRLRWDPGPCWNEVGTFPPVALLVAATVVFGLILAFFLEQYTTGSLNDPIQAWRSLYGEENTTWTATVARNYYVAYALLACLGYPMESLDTATLDHGTVTLDLSAVPPECDTVPLHLANAAYLPAVPTVTSPAAHPSPAVPAASTASTETESIVPTPLPARSPFPRPSNTFPRCCPHCHTSFRTLSSYNEHIRHPPLGCSNPRKPDPFRCHLCGRTQTKRDNHNTHVRRCEKRAERGLPKLKGRRG